MQSAVKAGSVPVTAEQIRGEQERRTETAKQEYVQDGLNCREVVKEQLGDHQREHDVSCFRRPIDQPRRTSLS
jgi:hypothetical protein